MAYARILDAGKGNPTGGLGLVVADDVEYPHRLYDEGNMDAPCRVSLGDDSHNDIHCMLHMDELDLYVLGFKLNVLSDEVNSANGAPICDNDNSRLIVNGPNCCIGDYKLTVTSAETGESTTSVHAWGGETYADCYDGGGWLLKGLKVPEHAFPPIPIEEQGSSDRYIYHNASIVPTNVQLANFWDLADGPRPDTLTQFPARPDSTFTCLDDAQEFLARIRLQVREWNEEVQFDTNGNPDSSARLTTS